MSSASPPPTLSLILGSFLGESSALESEREDLVRRLGVVHLFVVSGLHVGLLLIALLRLFRPLGAAGQASPWQGCGPMSALQAPRLLQFVPAS